MPGEKQETPQTTQISGSMKTLINSMRRGASVETRTETLLRGVIQAGHAAAIGGPNAYAEFNQALTAAIPALCVTVAGATITSATGAGVGGGTGGKGGG
jgi:hypothetical protein